MSWPLANLYLFQVGSDALGDCLAEVQRLDSAPGLAAPRLWLRYRFI